jgi:hypothetical protein
MAARDRWILLYWRALQLGAVQVTTGELQKPTRLTAGDPFGAAGHSKGIARAQLWMPKPAHAALVVERCRVDFRDAGATVRGGWIDSAWPDVVEKARLAAADLGVTIATGPQVRATIEAAVDAIDRRVELMRQSGGLAALNAAYKQHRVDAQRAGLGAPPYTAWVKQFTERLVVVVAENIRAVPGGELGDLSAVAPEQLQALVGARFDRESLRE